MGNVSTMNSMLDMLTPAERQQAYSDSPINEAAHKIAARIARARKEEDNRIKGEDYEQTD